MKKRLQLTPAALAEALTQIPLEKKPVIAPELLDFYATQFPDYPIILACFNNKDSKQASPIMLHFKPAQPTQLFYNLLEGHDGAAPELNRLVKRHQTVIAGSNLAQPDHLQFHIEYQAYGVPEHLLPFLPTVIDVEYLHEESPNGDGWWALN